MSTQKGSKENTSESMKTKIIESKLIDQGDLSCQRRITYLLQELHEEQFQPTQVLWMLYEWA
jgi:hypothetical protein